VQWEISSSLNAGLESVVAAFPDTLKIRMEKEKYNILSILQILRL
jgi:hypothetical protein